MAIIKKNMGNKDRLSRGILGSFLLIDGIYSKRKIEIGFGALNLLYGLTGFDPLMKIFGASTISGAKDNIIRQLIQIIPVKGINPILTQQPIPKKKVHGLNLEKNLADSLAIR